ncbi:MAG TPA: hypothetical protein VIL40_02625 [Thermaerobacter sp.]
MTQPMVPSPRSRPPRLRRRRDPGRTAAARAVGPRAEWSAAQVPFLAPEPPVRRGFWARFTAELAYLASLRRLWLVVAAAGFLIGFLLGTWFGHDLARVAHLR